MPTEKAVPAGAADVEKPLRADARRNRARVLEVASQLFITEGMSVPIDDIAAKAGVGVGTVYRHFPTKEALFEAIMLRRIELVVANARALAQAADPDAAFFSFFTDVVSQSDDSKGLYEALTEAGFGLQAAFGELSQQMLTAMDVLLTRAKQAGAVRQDITVTDVKALMTGLTAMRRQGGDAKITLDVVLAGLRPRPDGTG